MIEVIPEVELSAQDETQIVEVIRECFPTDYAGRSFYQQRPHVRLVRRKQVIVAQLSVFYRSIRLGGELVPIIGIGDVACLPEHRGQGIGSALMARALELGTRSQADFALLFGKRTLYDRAGFVAQKNPYLCVDMTGAQINELAQRDANFLMVRLLKSRNWPEGEQVDFLGPLF